MKPDIEYRPKARVAQRKGPASISVNHGCPTAKTSMAVSTEDLDSQVTRDTVNMLPHDPSKRTVSIDRAKYNAYQRDYKKAKRLGLSVKDYRASNNTGRG